MRHPSSPVLIATLGSEPQVVTLALDLLRGRGHPITDVVIVHTAPTQEPIATAFARLKNELPYYKRKPKAQSQSPKSEIRTPHSAAPPVAFHFAPIEREDGVCPTDIVTEQDAGAVFRTLYREVLQAKRERRRVHLSVAGGRKVMSVYGMAVAQILFDDDDCLWHVLSEGRLLTEKRMHAETGDEIVLIPVPVLRWGSISPVATELALTEDPYQAVQKQRALRAAEAARRKLEFLRQNLTDAQRELVELLVREALSNKDLARRLHRSVSTVNNQLTPIYDKFAKHFHLPRCDRAVLIAEFAPLLTNM